MNWIADLTAWFAGLGADPAGLRMLFLLGAGGLGFLVALTITLVIRRATDPVKERIDQFGEEIEIASGVPMTERLAARLGRELVPKDAEKRNRLATRLIQAGYRNPRALPIFFGFKVIGLLLLPALAAAWLILVRALPPGEALPDVLILGLIGFLLPDVWLSRALKQRRQKLSRALPDALDMLVVCSEAGLGLNASIDRVGNEIEIQHAELSHELLEVTMEMRAGLDSSTAMKNLVDRCGLDEMRSLVAALQQAMRFGTSIADSLRIYADDLRDRRLQKAEEMAAKLEVKMLFPIALLIMPAFLLVALGPPILSLGKSLGGG